MARPVATPARAIELPLRARLPRDRAQRCRPRRTDRPRSPCGCHLPLDSGFAQAHQLKARAWLRTRGRRPALGMEPPGQVGADAVRERLTERGIRFPPTRRPRTPETASRRTYDVETPCPAADPAAHPEWDREGRRRDFRVDHIVELQVSGQMGSGWATASRTWSSSTSPRTRARAARSAAASIASSTGPRYPGASTRPSKLPARTRRRLHQRRSNRRGLGGDGLGVVDQAEIDEAHTLGTASAPPPPKTATAPAAPRSSSSRRPRRHRRGPLPPAPVPRPRSAPPRRARSPACASRRSRSPTSPARPTALSARSRQNGTCPPTGNPPICDHDLAPGRWRTAGYRRRFPASISSTAISAR